MFAFSDVFFSMILATEDILQFNGMIDQKYLAGWVRLETFGF